MAEEESPKISEALDEVEFITAGLPPEVAAKAARAARESREARIPELTPDKEAYREEHDHLKAQAEKSD